MAWVKNKVFNNGKEFVDWLEKNYGNTVNTVISRVHVHHTYKPDHSNNQSTLQLHKNMRNYHVNTNGWQDVAQHITIGKDGKIVLGRNILVMPASATGYNGTTTNHPFMFETIGNFDKGNDTLSGNQLDSVLAVCHYIHVTKGKPVVFHRECLINGRAPKTCPGSGLDKTKFMTQVNNYKDGKVGSVMDSGSNTVEPPKTQTKSSNSNEVSWKKLTGNWTGQTLKQGQYGTPVKQLQEKLASKHFYPNKGAKNNGIDSYYGADTADAVRRFQSVNGLTADGIAGKKTYEKLNGKTASKTASKSTSKSLPDAVYRANKPYPKGANIKKVQQALASVYFYPDKGAKNNGIDSVYGPKTADAVKRFQSVNGLTADGVYGPATRKKLLSVMK